jgi:protein-S-isoprenylcysteine O-methyltransferase Ste14
MFWIGYAAGCYALFLGSILYLVGFVLDLLVPKAVDGGHNAGPVALLVDVALFTVFGVQHSVMARPKFKAWLTRLVPAYAERSTFILGSVAALVILMAAWQPLATDIWRVSGVPAVLLDAIALGGIALAFLATFMIDHFEFGGLRQPWNHATGRPAKELPFTQRFMYRYVRHPIMLGFLLLFWVTPRMTVGHLVFAALGTGYIALGIHFEERNLRTAIGPEYEEYRREIPAVLPVRLRRG